MSAQNILLDIQLSYNQFTRTEKKIADFVLQDPGRVLFMSITEMAEECGVAEASVHRFVRAAGARGYQEFKMKLSLGLPTEESKEIREEDTQGMDAIFSEILQYHLDAIRETNSLLEAPEVEKTLKMMQEAGQIQFFGVGDSLLTAIGAANRFLRITPKVRVIADPQMQAMAASMATAQDLMFLISYSGSSRETVHVAQVARQAGAKIVVITRYLKSPLTEYADAILICGPGEGPMEGGSMGTTLSQLHIIDILFQCYYQRTLDVSRLNKYKTSGSAEGPEGGS